MRIGSRNGGLPRLIARSALVFVWLAIGFNSRQACAYLTFGDLFGFDDYFPNKWGATTVGTSATVRWTFMADGTQPGFFNEATGGSNISQLRTSIGPAAFDEAVARAFTTWSNAANINFIYEPMDSGLPSNHPGAGYPEIRIGAFQPVAGTGFQFVGAVGFAPPPNGGTLEGDIFLNLAAGFQIAAGTEDVTPIDFSMGNDLEGLLLHEIGHALGLAHPDPNDPLTLPDDVMLIHDFDDPYLVNRRLSADDLAGVRHIYGLRNPQLGDFNLDGNLTPSDIQAMLRALVNLADFQWGKGVSNADLLAIGDLNHDDKVTNGDIQSLLNLLASSGSIAAVPEPATAGLLLSGVVLVGLRRRRRGG